MDSSPHRRAPDLRSLRVEQVRPHPKNCNRMPVRVMAKLRTHLRRSGLYQPLIVRPHPTEDDEFELLDGHHRLLLLKEIGHAYVHCIVWPVNDADALVLLASLNRLRGSDTPNVRAALLNEIARDCALDQMKALLPESDAALEALSRSHDDQEVLAPGPEDFLAESVRLEFRVGVADAERIDACLATAQLESPRSLTRGQALAQVARQWSVNHA